MPITTIEINRLFLRTKSVYLKHGFFVIINKVRHIASDSFFDFKFNIETKQRLGKENRAAPLPDSLEYVGSRYTQLLSVFRKIPVDYSNSVLLEIGCGKGRAIAVAATHEFKKIIGIDYEENLVALAKKNLNQMRFKKTNNIVIQHQNATLYKIPNDINVIYLFNPFIGETLKKVVENIHQSYVTAPRKILIIYLNEVDFDLLIENKFWLTKITTLPTVDTVSCSLYVTQGE